MLEDSDIKFLDERYDSRYKNAKECEKEMRDASAEHHALDNRLSIIEVQQKINNWLTAAIAGGIIALVIKVFIGG